MGFFSSPHIPRQILVPRIGGYSVFRVLSEYEKSNLLYGLRLSSYVLVNSLRSRVEIGAPLPHLPVRIHWKVWQVAPSCFMFLLLDLFYIYLLSVKITVKRHL